MDHAVRQQLGDGRDASLVGQVSRGEDQRCFLAVQVGELAIASVVTDMQDPVTPVLKAALAGEELHDAGRVIARLSRIVDHGAAAIDENLLRVRAVEIYLGHVQPPPNATVPHDAMRPLPPSRTPRTLAQNPRCAPSATPGLSTTTSSSGGLSTEPRNDDSACRTSWPAIVQQNADFGPYTRAGDDGSKIESNEGQKENHLSPWSR